MSGNDIADSTDWLSTPLSALTPLESALRCQICKDFYETPMISTCSHTFCSLCIRRALSAEGKCPLCRNNEQELKLRSNWAMEEAVEAFKKARADVLALARRPEAVERSPKRKADEVEDEGDKPAETKRLRSSARLSQNRTQSIPSYAPEQMEEEEVIPISDHEDDYVPEPADGLVPCPMCQSRMKEWQVFSHLEHCTGPTDKPATKSSSTPSAPAMAAPRQHQKTIDRLPALNYGMYKDTALRKKMQELGLQSYGPRPLMEKRHKEWITLWNANCDAARPKKRSELLHDLDMWERTQGSRALTAGRNVHTATMVKDKEFDGVGWAAKHDDSFKDLIANARKSVQAKKKPQEEEQDIAGQEGQGTTAKDTDLAVNDTGHDPNGVPGAADKQPTPVGVPTQVSNAPIEDAQTWPSHQASTSPPVDIRQPRDDDIIHDGSHTFTRGQVERVRTGEEPYIEQIVRWCELLGQSEEDPGRSGGIPGYVYDNDYIQYSNILEYLTKEGIPRERTLPDLHDLEFRRNVAMMAAKVGIPPSQTTKQADTPELPRLTQ